METHRRRKFHYITIKDPTFVNSRIHSRLYGSQHNYFNSQFHVLGTVLLLEIKSSKPSQPLRSQCVQQIYFPACNRSRRLIVSHVTFSQPRLALKRLLDIPHLHSMQESAISLTTMPISCFSKFKFLGLNQNEKNQIFLQLDALPR